MTASRRSLSRFARPLLLALVLALGGCVAYPAYGPGPYGRYYAPGYAYPPGYVYASPPVVVGGGGWYGRWHGGGW